MPSLSCLLVIVSACSSHTLRPAPRDGGTGGTTAAGGGGDGGASLVASGGAPGNGGASGASPGSGGYPTFVDAGGLAINDGTFNRPEPPPKGGLP